MKLTKKARNLFIVLLGGGLVGGFFYAKKSGTLEALQQNVAPSKKEAGDVPKGAFGKETAASPADKVAGDASELKVGVVTWGGYAGAEYFNGGFEPNPDSRYLKDYGLKVRFVVIDDFNASRAAWKSDKLDVLWGTADSFPTEVNGLKDFEPKIIYQADWSRGGDTIIATEGIKSVADLKGKTVAVSLDSPSYTFLLWLLDAGDLSIKDVNVKGVDDPNKAAQEFNAHSVDAAVVWSPLDEDCLKAVRGAHTLKSTKEASNIIADVFFVKKAYLEGHKKELKALLEGWMIGAGEINSSDAAKDQAAKILAAGLNEDQAAAKKAIEKTRLANYGDNANFFNLKGDFAGVKGQDLYTTMSTVYTAIGEVKEATPDWRAVVDTSLLRDINLAGKPDQEAEGTATFTAPTAAEKTAPALAVKRVTINFPTGVTQLDENAKSLIDIQFGKLAKGFARSRIRIEGNTDNTGSEQKNKAISYKRAEAVADFLATEYGFSKNRFVVVGNGDTKPVADNGTSDGKAKNRRTDFELLSE